MNPATLPINRIRTYLAESSWRTTTQIADDLGIPVERMSCFMYRLHKQGEVSKRAGAKPCRRTGRGPNAWRLNRKGLAMLTVYGIELEEMSA
jgi:predicted ArsR family transcriptional regulator